MSLFAAAAATRPIRKAKQSSEELRKGREDLRADLQHALDQLPPDLSSAAKELGAMPESKSNVAVTEMQLPESDVAFLHEMRQTVKIAERESATGND